MSDDFDAVADWLEERHFPEWLALGVAVPMGVVLAGLALVWKALRWLWAKFMEMSST